MIKSGDNCEDLAKTFHTTFAAILEANKPAIDSICGNLQIGQIVRIPGLAPPANHGAFWLRVGVTYI